MITELQAALRNYPPNFEWFVLLCPTPAAALEHSRMLGVLLPREAKFSGRTALVQDKRISIAAASDAVFIPPDVPFALGLIGWGATAGSEAQTWQARASLLVNTDR